MSKKIKALLFIVVLALLAFSIIHTKNQRLDDYQFKVIDFERKTNNTLNFCLEKAVWEEFYDRVSLPETNSVLKIDALADKIKYASADTSSFFTRTIVTMDTTFQVCVRKDNVADHLMISQFIMKKQNPVNLEKLESLLMICLKRNMAVKECFIEYLDLEQNMVINQSKKVKPANCIASDVQHMDIINTIGVKAYIVTDYPEFWDKDMKDKMKGDILFGVFTFLFLFGLVLFGDKLFSKQH